LSKNTVTVIMRCKNSGWVIKEALDSLFAQSFKQFKLLVVDSGSTDDTIEIVNNYDCELIQIPATDYYPGTVLNNALKLIETEFVVFHNSDSIFQKTDSLSKLLEAFSDDKVQAAYARQIIRPEAHTWVKRDYKVSFPENEPAPEWITISLVTSAFRMSIFNEHQFYEDAWGSEDIEYGYWLQKNNYKIKYEPNCIVMHSHNYTLKQMLRRRFIEGEADAYIFDAKSSIFNFLIKFSKSVVIDFFYYCLKGDYINIIGIPIRRWCYHLGYLKGNRLGQTRKRSNNTDRSKAQKVVFKNYD